MEIEAKFAIPDRQTHHRLARLRQLAGYRLVAAGVGQVADRYFDTADARLLAGGYACRLRTEAEQVIATLKGLGGGEGAVHRRAEHEVRLPRWTPDITAWPESAARTLALELTGGASLAPLFDLAQTRTRADIMADDRHVAQLSVDAVHLNIGGRPTHYYEIEAELTGDGTEADLAQIVGELHATWGLIPESRSKFERGLAAWRAYHAELAGRLSADEHTSLQTRLADPDPLLAQRAAIILGWADGALLNAIATRHALSLGRVRYWLRAFKIKRMGVFGAVNDNADKGADPLGAAPTHAAATPPPQPVPPPSRPTPSVSRPPTVMQFAAAHDVDRPHAVYVAAQARLLFDALRPIHRLPRRRRRLLKLAALLGTVGATTDAERPHEAGRDLVLAHPLRNVSTADRLALACLIAFSRGKARPEREPTYTAVDEKFRPDLLPLAAIVRVAEALDFSHTQATEILGLEDIEAPYCEIAVAGPVAETDAVQATAQASLWHKLFGQEWVFVPPARESLPVQPELPAEPALSAAEPAAPAVAAPPPILPHEPMSEAGRKVLGLHYAKMLANEAGTRAGEEIESLHDMRVATRRMRAAFQLFAPHFDADALKTLGKGLRRTGRTLGAVRDLDVLLDKARAYATTLPPEQTSTLEPLLSEWLAHRDVARRQMLEYLDGRAYRQFATDFGAFVTTPGAAALALPPGAPIPYQVRHIVPRLILTRYEAVRAYEAVIPGAPQSTLHSLRIECKGLRYTLEFFREILTPEAPDLVNQVTAMQDLLGELHDAYVAEGLLTDFLAGQRGKGHKRSQPPSLIGVEAYLAAQRAKQVELVEQFPAPWAELIGPAFRRSLVLAFAAL